MTSTITGLIPIPKIPDERGNLSFLQSSDQLPFDIKSVYWINDIPSGAARPGQANRRSQEVIIALSGSFDVIVNNGAVEQVYRLTRPDVGLYIPPMVWRSMENFSTNSVAFICTNGEPLQADLIDEFSGFKMEVDNGAEI